MFRPTFILYVTFAVAQGKYLIELENYEQMNVSHKLNFFSSVSKSLVSLHPSSFNFLVSIAYL